MVEEHLSGRKLDSQSKPRPGCRTHRAGVAVPQQQHEGLGAGVLHALAADELGCVRHRPHRRQHPIGAAPWSWTTEHSDIVAAGGALQTSLTSAAAIGLCEQRPSSCAWPKRRRISSAGASPGPPSAARLTQGHLEKRPHSQRERGQRGAACLSCSRACAGRPAASSASAAITRTLSRLPLSAHRLRGQKTCRCANTSCGQGHSRPPEQPLQLQAGNCMHCVLPDSALGSESRRTLSLDVTGWHRR